jgi:hypothetical protein
MFVVSATDETSDSQVVRGQKVPFNYGDAYDYFTRRDRRPNDCLERCPRGLTTRMDGSLSLMFISHRAAVDIILTVTFLDQIVNIMFHICNGFLIDNETIYA